MQWRNEMSRLDRKIRLFIGVFQHFLTFFSSPVREEFCEARRSLGGTSPDRKMRIGLFLVLSLAGPRL